MLAVVLEVMLTFTLKALLVVLLQMRLVVFGLEPDPDVYFEITCDIHDGKILGYIYDRGRRPVTKFDNFTALDFIVLNGVSCSSRNTTYAEYLKPFNLDFPKRFSLIYKTESDLSPWKFQDLKVKILEIEYVMKDFENGIFNPNILTNMTDLRELIIQDSHVPIIHLPQLKKLTLIGGKSLGELGNCSNLEYLEIRQWNTTLIPPYWLENCTQLKTIILEYQSLESVKQVLSHAYSATELEISNCPIRSLSTELLQDQQNISKLKVEYGELRSLSLNLHKLRLKELDLSNNELSDSAEILYIIENLMDLVNFSVANNPLLDVCKDYRTLWKVDDIYLSPHLKRMSFDDTATTTLCYKEVIAESLEYLYLSGTKITSLKFQELPLSGATSLKEIYLINTLLEEHDFNEKHYEKLKGRRNKLTFIGANLFLECDCSDAWLARGILDGLLALDAYCGTTRLEHMSNATLECTKYRCENCTCRRSWSDWSITAHCNGNQKNIPKVTNLTRLFAAGNLIEGFNVTDLPEFIILLDLTQNHIANLDAMTVKTLFNSSQRLVRLAGNPIICTCENIALLEGLKTHHKQVEDYDNLVCAGDERPVSSLDLIALCLEPTDARIPFVFAVVLGVVAVGAIGAVLWKRLERRIKIFLYARGCCLWWLSEEDLDSDRRYDVFLSFAHGDDEFVMTNLLPELERLNYRVCIHYRDWVPGEWIPAQIASSVEQSRRTIIVLSKKYLASVWGMMEFRIAHLSTLKEGRPRIIVLMLEDVTKEEMSPELRGYLYSNTYVQWGEPWFWDKMKYAMPHRTAELAESSEDGIIMEDLIQ